MDVLALAQRQRKTQTNAMIWVSLPWSRKCSHVEPLRLDERLRSFALDSQDAKIELRSENRRTRHARRGSSEMMCLLPRSLLLLS
jgi:hypothetical protein